MSKIEVDAITQQSGTTLTVGGGASKTVVADATTVTLGRCGGTVALASGASQTGFGRTGTVDWQTTPKTGDFTAVNGEGYFINTTSGGVVMTMPSGSAGAIVSIQDYNKTFDSNNFTVTPASGEIINGGTAGANLVLSTEGQGLTFVYVDGTVGWKTVQENDFTTGGSTFIIATGGTVTCCGNCKIHTFTGPGTFCVSSGGSPTNAVVSYMVVAGGGGGASNQGSWGGGGGGAGGFREFKSPLTPYTASPLDGNPGGTSISITAGGAFPITVGAAGAAAAAEPAPSGVGGCGSNSIFSTVTSTGGGGGGAGFPAIRPSTDAAGKPGGSGGGATASYYGGPGGANAPGGTGNTPPVSPSQGNNGGTANTHPPCRNGAGGGGAGAVGGDNGGAGGAGVATSITGSSVTRAGGGGPGGIPPCSSAGAGGAGGGGAGSGTTSPGSAATVNTGGGGGGAGKSTPGARGGAGGSGIVVIRYKFQ
jgi:hypothetical protein